MAEGPELDDIYINEIPVDYQVPFSWEYEALVTDNSSSSTNLAAEFSEPVYETASEQSPHPPLPPPAPPSPPPLKVRPPLPCYEADYRSYGSSHPAHRANISTESLDSYPGDRHPNSRVRLLSSAFNSESRAKIKDAILKGRDYLMTKVQDYQQRIRINMNHNRQHDMTNNHACKADDDDVGSRDCLHLIQSTDGFCPSYKKILPSYEELMQMERSDNTIKENLDADSDKDLVSLNLQNSQEYDSISESKTNEEPLLEGLPVEEEEVAVADILNQSSSMIASADDDLPLGTEANTLSGLPSTAVLSSPGSQNVEEEHQYSSLSLPAKSSSSLTSLGQQASNTHPWLQALSGRQQSFGSDLSTGTTSSVNSIEILLQGREADPEEILMSLGFGSTEDDSTVTSRIPSRFLMLNSEARGVSVDDLFGQHSELQELISNWNCPKYTTGNWNNPTPRLSPYLHGIRFLSSVRAAAAANRSSVETVDSIPNSILTPDNQLALAKQGYYDSFPSKIEEGPIITKATTQTTNTSNIASPTSSQPLSASEKRQKFKSTKISQPWSLIIESEGNHDQPSNEYRPSTSTLATSIDSSFSSDNVDRSSVGHRASVSELRWSYLNNKSRDSVSSTSSISQSRQIQVSKLMNNEMDDGDYQVEPKSPPHSERANATEEDVFFKEEITPEVRPMDCPDSFSTDFNSTSMQTSPKDSSWEGFSAVNVSSEDCLSKPVEQSTPEKYVNVYSGYLADGEGSYVEPLMREQGQDLYKDAVPSSVELEDPNASHLPRDVSDLEMSFIPNSILTDDDEKVQEFLEKSASQEKSPIICRYESAQSDSSGFAEPDLVVVNVQFPTLDSLSVHQGSCDSFETLGSSRLQRLSINSDTTIKELGDHSPYTFDTDFISVCDKSTTTDIPSKADKKISTESAETSHKAIQTDALGLCRCLATPKYKPPMLGQLSKSNPLGNRSTSLNCSSIQDNALAGIKTLTSFDSGFSPSKHEVSVLNLHVYDGKIWFCDNDSDPSSKWSISGGQSTSSVHMYDQINQEPPESTEFVPNSIYGEFGDFSLQKQMTAMNRKSSPKNQMSSSHTSFDLLDADQPKKRSSRLSNKEQICEYKKLLKLTNQRFSFQCFVKNVVPMYSPHFQIDVWCERHIDEHLQEENQLMQYAVQRYKSDLQVMESAFLTEFNRTNGLLSYEDTLQMDELYELWTDISLEIVHLERLLADRQRLIRRGECELTTLTTLDVIQTMIEVLKEQLYLFHINNDIVKSSTCEEMSTPPIYHQPGWKDISREVHELRHQIMGHETLQAINLKKAVQEIKDTILSDIQQEITQNINKLSAVT